MNCLAPDKPDVPNSVNTFFPMEHVSSRSKSRVMKPVVHIQDVRLASWLLATLVACFIAYITRLHEVTHDLFHELALARSFWTTSLFPIDDIFAYSSTVSPSVHHEWGTGMVMYLATVESGWGVWGITVVKSLLCLILWVTIYFTARRRGAHPYVFAVVSLAVFPFFWVGFATIRAQLFTLVCIAIQLWMQERDRDGGRAWIVLWLAMCVVWLNLHAGFIVGLCLMAVHGLERVLSLWHREPSMLAVLRGTWHLFLAALCVPPALLINPYGSDYIPYLCHAILMSRPTIAEWQPLWHTYAPITTLIAFALCLGLILYVVRQLPKREYTGLANTILCAWMALKHIRHGSIYGVVWLVYVPAWLSKTAFGQSLIAFIDERSTVVKRVCQVLIISHLGFAVYHQFWRPTVSGHRDYSIVCFPTGAVEYLKAQQFRGNVMTPFHVGAYVSWELFPDVKVSLDGRYEVAYQPHVYDEHRRFYDGDAQWQEIIERYSSDCILIHREAKVARLYEAHGAAPESFRGGLNLVSLTGASRSESGTIEENSSSADEKDWQLVYQDDSYQLYARTNLQLPIVDQRTIKLPDRARETFSRANALRLSDHSQLPAAKQ